MQEKKLRFKPNQLPAYAFGLFFTLLTFVPLYLTLISSFDDNQGIILSMFTWPEELLWSNYVAAWTSAHMGIAVFNSMFIAIASTVVVIAVSMPAAYVLARKKFKLQKLVYTFFLLGVMVPVHSTVIPIATLATRTGGRNTYWFIVLVYAAFNLSQSIFLLTGYLRGIDRELDQAAKIDGCNDYQLLWFILFPICKPMIATVSILTFVFAYGELLFSLILISHERMYTVARGMLTFSGAFNQQLGPIFASIIIAVIPMIVLYLFFHEKVQAGMMAGAIKD